MSVKVYSKPGCPPCDSTKRALTRAGIPFDIIDLAQTPEAFDEIASLGYRQAPVVVANDAHWAGFQPSKIDALALSLVAHG